MSCKQQQAAHMQKLLLRMRFGNLAASSRKKIHAWVLCMRSCWWTRRTVALSMNKQMVIRIPHEKKTLCTRSRMILEQASHMKYRTRHNLHG